MFEQNPMLTPGAHQAVKQTAIANQGANPLTPAASSPMAGGMGAFEGLQSYNPAWAGRQWADSFAPGWTPSWAHGAPNASWGTNPGYDGSTPDVPPDVMGYDSTTPTTPTAPTTSPTGPNLNQTMSPFPSGAQTLGQPMYPWLMPYQGQFTAPMSPYQNQALQGQSNLAGGAIPAYMQGLGGFVGGGMGLGGAQSYLGNLLGGQYTNAASNPYLQQIQSSAQQLHNYNDQLERQRINSSMAAGGNALSGANAAAQEQYQNQSDNQFQNMMGNLMNQNYQFERGLQNQAVPMEMGLANTQLGGYGALGSGLGLEQGALNNLMNMGAVPQQLSQSNLNSQYADWLRQIGAMQNAYNLPNQMGYEMLHSGYPGSAPPNYGQSQAAGWAGLLSALFGGQGGGALGSLGSGGQDGSGILGALGSLFGGGTGSPGTIDNTQQGWGYGAGNPNMPSGSAWGYGTGDPSLGYPNPSDPNYGYDQSSGGYFGPSAYGNDYGYYDPNQYPPLQGPPNQGGGG